MKEWKFLGGELRAVEGDVASFRAQTGAINLVGEGPCCLMKVLRVPMRWQPWKLRLQINQAIKKQLQTEGEKFNFVPTSEGLTTPAIFNLLTTFNQSLLERERIVNRLGPKHPDLEVIDKQLVQPA
jgi:hypothetical protein